MDYAAFVNGNKTLLVSPAGYGKTFTIVECLKHTSGKQLILTHTHAGISSIKEKIREAGLKSSCCVVETISSFTQQFVLAFCRNAAIPAQEKSKEYHKFIITKAASIFAIPLVQKIIAFTYCGIFVDEYQDCSMEQHAVIILLAKILPFHILGDPMQSIFDFNGSPVNMDIELAEFEKFPDLDIPMRWYKDSNNKTLGDKLRNCRELLVLKKPLALIADNAAGFHVVQVPEANYLKSNSEYLTKLKNIVTNKNKLAGMDSLLILVPEYESMKNGKPIRNGSITQRARIRDRIDFTSSVILLEAIDDKSFYSLALEADGLITNIQKARKKYKKIREGILDKLFPAGKIIEWFNEEGLIAKKSSADKIKSKRIRLLLDNFILSPSAGPLYELVMVFSKEFRMKFKRQELGRSFVTGLKQSHLNNISVYQAVKDNRNLIRRNGRKVHGKCIATTLLTKGLEFDTVVLLDAHRFDSPEHLYVALTRCCKRLIIFTENLVLAPYR